MNRRAKIQGSGIGLGLAELFQHANDLLAGDGVSIAQIADEARTQTSRVYAYQGADSETLLRVLAVVVAQATLGRPLVLERLADQAGFLLVPAPHIAKGELDRATVDAIASCMKEFSEAVQAFASAVGDGRVTPSELAEYRKQKREAESALEALDFLACSLGGDAREGERSALNMRGAERQSGGGGLIPRPAPSRDSRGGRRR